MTDPMPNTPINALQDPEITQPARSQWRDVWDQFKHHKGALLGGGFLIFVTLAVLFGDMIWQIDPKKLDIRNKDVRPIYTAIWNSDAKVSWGNPLGTDNLGRDQLAQVIAVGAPRWPWAGPQ